MNEKVVSYVRLLLLRSGRRRMLDESRVTANRLDLGLEDDGVRLFSSRCVCAQGACLYIYMRQTRAYACTCGVNNRRRILALVNVNLLDTHRNELERLVYFCLKNLLEGDHG